MMYELNNALILLNEIDIEICSKPSVKQPKDIG